MLLVCLGCSKDPGNALLDQIAEAVDQEPNRIEMAKQVPGDWDRMCVFRFAVPPEIVHQVIGFAWPEVFDTGIDTSRKHNLIVFIKQMTVQQSLMHEMSNGDFTGERPAYCIPRDSAVFKVANLQERKSRRLVINREALAANRATTGIDFVQMMETAAHYARPWGRRVLVDPGTAHNAAAEIAKRLKLEVGNEYQAASCEEYYNGTNCLRQKADAVIRVSAPEPRDTTYTVRVLVMTPRHGRPAETTRDFYQVTLKRYNDRWISMRFDRIQPTSGPRF